MATTDEAKAAVTDAIAAMAPQVKQASSLLALAEALAWVRSPSQPHSGSVSVKS